MEPTQRDDHPTETAERSAPKAGDEGFTVPFASEGLEALRDSHC